MPQNATTGALPAVVTISDLPTGTTITGAELLEAVQTVGGIGNSIQITLGNIMTSALGALPTGGATGQILNKTSGGNFSATWSNVTQFVAVGAGLATSGSATSISIALANQSGLTLLGVAGTAVAAPAAIGPATADQVLVANHGGTGLAFGPVNLATSAAVTGVLAGANMSAVNLAASGAGGVQGVLPVPNGGTNTTALTAFGVVYGNGSSALGATPAGTTSWPLVANGTLVAPAFQQLNLGSGGVTGTLPVGNLTGVLGVPNGGTNTSTLTAHAVVLGAGSATVQFAAVATAGNLLIDQGTAANPAFTVVSGDFTISAAGTTTIGANKVSYGKIQQGTGLSVLGVAGTSVANFSAITGAAAQVLAVNAAGTTLGFETVSQVIDAAIGSTQGNILYRNAATWVALAPAGTGGQFLQSPGSGGNPLWTGGLALLNTLTPSAVASAVDTTSISSNYANYLIVFENVVPANSTGTLQLQLATTGTAFLTTGYLSVAQCSVNATTAFDNSTTAILLSGTRATTAVGTASSSQYGVSGQLLIANATGASAKRMASGQLVWCVPGAETTATLAIGAMVGVSDSFVNPISGLSFSFTPGNIAGGTIKIYGMA